MDFIVGVNGKVLLGSVALPIDYPSQKGALSIWFRVRQRGNVRGMVSCCRHLGRQATTFVYLSVSRHY